MLTFFRKNQRIFFLFITIVIIVTFVFFGTYNALGPTVSHDEAAFEAVDGKEVSGLYLDQMNRFLRSDAYEASLRASPNRIYSGNFLNDGVIAKDFLQTGMAQVIFQHYVHELYPDLQARLDKEKHFSGYMHPYASFISAESAWGMFAPNLKQNLEHLKQASDAYEQNAFNTRVNLYLEERSFPPAFLKQVLLYQERQYDWLPQDASLIKDNLSLFGYHDVQDWFGPKFVDLISQVVINSAAIARDRGYKVSQKEALTDLIYRSELAYQSINDKSSLSAKNGYGYLQEYLRLTQMDELTLVKVWQDVLLFRRLFNDIGASVFVDALTIKEFQQFAAQAADVETYTMPQEFHFKDVNEMQQFEVYLDMVAGKERDTLMLPQSLRSIEEIEKAAPQLVEKRYWVEIAHVNKNSLQSQISVKETWNWELQSSNFEALKQRFPELSLKQANSEEERFQALESLEARTRMLVDQFARESIIADHPEWMAKAIEEASAHEEILALGEGNKSLLQGITLVQDLVKRLDQASDEPFIYSQDQIHYYRIKLKEKAQSKNILTFKEASEKGILEKLLKTHLEKVPNSYENVLVAIQTDCKKQGVNISLEQKNDLVNYRFYAYLRSICEKTKAGSSEVSKFVAIEEEKTSSLLEKPSVQSQWKLQKISEMISRSQNHEMNVDEVLAMQNEEFSKVSISSDRGPYFYQFIKQVEQKEEIAKQMKEYQEMLACEAKCNALREYLGIIQEKQAISLRTP